MPKTIYCFHCNTVLIKNQKKFCSKYCFCENTKIETSKKVANGICINKKRVKRYLIEIGGHICTNCNLTEWFGQLIPLELDHINGDSTNNSLDNLRILCPNCHAQTPTYRGLNIKNPLVQNMKETRYQRYQKQ